MCRFFPLIVLTMVLAVASGRVFAASFSVEWFDNGTKAAVHIDGPLEREDVPRFMDFAFKQVPPYRLWSLVLNSPGGDFGAVEPIVQAIIDVRADRNRYPRGLHLGTSVPKGNECSSACVLLFACGEPRFAHATARIGIHSARNRENQEDATSYTIDTWAGRLLKACGVPEYLIGKMITTPADEMYWLTLEDLRAMNVHIDGQMPHAEQSQLDKRERCKSKARGAQFFCALAGYDPAYCLEHRLRVQQVCEVD